MSTLDPLLPDRVRDMVGDLEELARRTRALVEFPAVAMGQRDRFRTAAGRLQTSARRLAAATGRRRVDELIERAGKAMQQAGVPFRRAHEAAMHDLQVQVEVIT